MGPLFFRAENNSKGESVAITADLQWGRSFSERRTPRWLASWLLPPAFNGAALFQSGELEIPHSPDSVSRPSMGPLFFRAENLLHALLGRRWDALQWGRSFSERRTPLTLVLPPLTGQPSMGPLFFRAENIHPGRRLHRQCNPSMGPLFFRAENKSW